MQASTQEKYQNTFDYLMMRYQDETGRDWTLDAVSAVLWIAQKKSIVARNTFASWRSATLWVIRNRFPEQLVDIMNIFDGVKNQASRQTRIKTMKTVAPNDLQKIIDYAITHRISRVQFAIMIIMVGDMTGLRPIEWYKSKLSKKDSILTVVTAKTFDKDHSFAETRSLDLSGLDRENVQVIRAVVELANGCSDVNAWSRYLHNMRAGLYQACREVGLPGLRLYSGRHQFAANAKAAHLSEEEIAAMMGHRSIDAQKIYGRKKHARPDDARVRPSADTMHEFTNNPSIRLPKEWL